MTALRRPAALCFIILASFLLNSCVTVLPKTKPAQLYRFGIETRTSEAAANPGDQGLAISKTNIEFDSAAAGDRILTVTHQQVAYISGARWVTPAVTLFDAALTQAFATQAHSTRLTTDATTHAGGSLRLEVRRFEAVYDQGLALAPNIIVDLDASLALSGAPEHRTHILTAVRADDNRVGAIVSAFNQATGQALGGVVTWTDAVAAAH